MTATEASQPDVAERKEKAHLAQVLRRLDAVLTDIDQRLSHYARDVQEQKEYLWGHRAEMDHIEKIASRQSIEQSLNSGESLLERRRRLEKLRGSPYFGRLDFAREGHNKATPVYIGIHHFHDDRKHENVVYDWRAPIASLFYDFETGPAHYPSPEGPVSGDIRLKRQFRIRHGRLEMMIESALHVVDDVLQQTLSQSADDSMRHIVATIQRDQNAIIRDEDAHALIIQGVAGSGKTSIALHRIAFLLYRFRDTLSSEDILIISPNRVFADYISNVLPELGEESVNEIGMETLADELLAGQYRFQSFFEQTTALLEKDDEAMKARLRYKASPEFLRQLGQYAAEVEEQRFVADDLWIARRLVPGWLLAEIFRKHRRLGMRERVRQVVRETEQKIGIEYNYDLLPEERRELREAIAGMVRESTLRETYRGFFDWLDRPELFSPAGNRLEYADVFPLIYLKMRLDGVHSPYRNVRHLLIDEMQDYTPVQYAVIARLFSCKKTILGDANQSVNPYSASSAREIQQSFMEASRVVTLNRSYRSTWEITQFALRILPNPELKAMERHGPEPEVIRCPSAAGEYAYLKEAVAGLDDSRFNSLAIICKTSRQARKLHARLSEDCPELQLFSEESGSFAAGPVVCTAHMAKGLEFDRVLVTQLTAVNYRTPMDRNMLYVACTRAMHELSLTHTGPLSEFLEQVDPD